MLDPLLRIASCCCLLAVFFAKTDAFVSSAFVGTPSIGAKAETIGARTSAARPFVATRALGSSSSSLSSSLSSSSSSSSRAPDTKEATAFAASSSQADEVDPAYYLQVLGDAIHRNSTEASSVLLSKIAELRQQQSSSSESSSPPSLAEDFCNGLLANGPDAELPVWTRLRPLARTSRRARMRSLRRTLDRVTPEADAAGDDSPSLRQQRRRRALLSLLRSLSAETDNDDNDDETTTTASNLPAIVVLEQKAIAASKKDSAATLVTRRPEGLETPDYEILDSNSGKSSGNLPPNVEIRSYKPYSVCSVSMAKPRASNQKKDTDRKLGSPELGGASSFGALAGYLFGKNDQSRAMKMTTPVFTTTTTTTNNNNNNNNNEQGDTPQQEVSEGDANQKTMEFVLPSDYWDNLSGAPLPLESSGVTLEEKPTETRAVLLFGGYASASEASKRQNELLRALSASGWKAIGESETETESESEEYDDKSDDEPTVRLAQYNDPFTVPWKRLNEVSVRVVRKDKQEA